MPVITEAINLTSEDTLAVMLSKLGAATGDRVLLVIPSRMNLSAVDLRILRREAAAMSTNVALLTSDARLRRLSAEAGLSTFRFRGWAERARWRQARQDHPVRNPSIGTARPVAPYGLGLFDKRSPSGFRPASFRRSFVREHSSWWGTLGLALFLLAAFGGLLLAFSAVIPSAVITVTPSSEPIQMTVRLNAIQDSPTDVEAGIVPARALSAQVSGEARMPTSGRSLEPDKKASGKVVLINRGGIPVTVPSGTVVSTATGNNVQFATQAEAPLAPNGRAAVPILAVLPGPSGNVRAGTITRVEGPLALSVLVANDAPTSGGTLAKVGVVTEDDQKLLEAQLFERLKQQAFGKLMERLESGSFIPPESVEYLAMSPTFTPFVGEVSPELSLSMSAQAIGLAVDSGAGSEAAMARLQGAMPPGTRLISDTIRFIPGSVTVTDQRTVSFDITAEGRLLRQVDASAVRGTVLGMEPDEAASVLEERYPLATRPDIRLGPDWLPYIVPRDLPVLPWRIRVDVDWDGAAKLAMEP
jgi:Baseplate J-like protein